MNYGGEFIDDGQVETRSFDLIPNGNDPADVPPATVGPPAAVPGDPDGFVIVDEGPATAPPRPPRPAAWSGWPADWMTPNWWGRVDDLTDAAWMCLDRNASIVAAMPPYLVGAAPSLPAGWIANPDPAHYNGWVEFCRQLLWDYQLGEAFVIPTAYYANGYPARFHVAPPWTVNVEVVPGGRSYHIGALDVTSEILHIPYQITVGEAHGHGPLEVGVGRLVAARLLARYVTDFVRGGGIPNAVLKHPAELTQAQATQLQRDWVDARLSAMGLPAVLSGGVDFEVLAFEPDKLGLLDLARWNEARIAYLLGIPAPLVGLPSGQDSMHYDNQTLARQDHWQSGLKPKVAAVMQALSNWALPYGTQAELDRDEYVRPDPLTRAQTWDIYLQNGVVNQEEVRDYERFSLTGQAQRPIAALPAVEEVPA